MPKDDTDENIMNIRTVDDLNSEKSMNGGFGVRMCVFFSFTCEIEKQRYKTFKGWE